MTFEDFISLWARGSGPPKKHADVRLGQHLSNCLRYVRSDLYDRLSASEFDCFYDDKKIPAALTWIGEHWNDDK